MVDLLETKKRIISIVRSEGPVLPVQISRKLNQDTIFAGAVLSELVHDKTIRVSSAKVGGSPLYYMDGQESRLNLLYNHLPGKEKEAYELLRKHQILKDNECEPAIRVALRSIKDFSFPLEINSELYWRWYLTNEIDARGLVEKKEMPEIKEEIKQEVKIDIPEIKAESKQVSKQPEKKIELKYDLGDEFFSLVNGYLKRNKINILELGVLKKKREVEGKIKINSDLGLLEYFVIAKNKKKLNEADLSLASDKGRKHRLPVLFLSNGELTKKSEKYLFENLQGRVTFRKI